MKKRVLLQSCMTALFTGCMAVSPAFADQPGPAGVMAAGQSAPDANPASAFASVKEAQVPNVLVIMLDDVGFAASSAFGGPVHTPALERLAQSGLTYNRFHTTSVCSPTSASLLTRRNPHRVAAGAVLERPYPGHNRSWPKESATIARVLKDQGYTTAAFGKWHNTPVREVSPAGPFDRWPTGLGFQHFYGFMQGEDSQWEPLLYRNTTPVDRPDTGDVPYHFTEDITNEAIRFVRTQSTLAPQKPWFTNFATGGAHTPIT